jgi:hypothetical protein
VRRRWCAISFSPKLLSTSLRSVLLTCKVEILSFTRRLLDSSDSQGWSSWSGILKSRVLRASPVPHRGEEKNNKEGGPTTNERKRTKQNKALAGGKRTCVGLEDEPYTSFLRQCCCCRCCCSGSGCCCRWCCCRCCCCCCRCRC